MALKHSAHGANPDSALPALAVLSQDNQLIELVERAAGSEWAVIRHDPAQISSLIRDPNIRLVIFDDQSVSGSDRGWALSEIQRWTTSAPIIYVAGEHDYANEKQARTRGVLFYTSKPLMPGDVSLVLRRLSCMRDRRPDLRIKNPRTKVQQS
jgi:DNA-binding NtrC family response regulator